MKTKDLLEKFQIPGFLTLVILFFINNIAFSQCPSPVSCGTGGAGNIVYV